MDDIADASAEPQGRMLLDVRNDADIALPLIEFQRLGVRLVVPIHEGGGFRCQRLEVFKSSIELCERVIKGMRQRFQPYRGGDFAFYHPVAQLYRLWNRDKHRTLNVTFAMVAEYGFRLAIVQDIASIEEPTFRLGEVEDGAEILRFPFVPSGPAPQVKLETQVTLDIGIDNGLRIPSLLANIGDVVQHILNRVSEAFPESPTFDEWKAAQEGPPPAA